MYEFMTGVQHHVGDAHPSSNPLLPQPQRGRGPHFSYAQIYILFVGQLYERWFMLYSPTTIPKKIKHTTHSLEACFYGLT